MITVQYSIIYILYKKTMTLKYYVDAEFGKMFDIVLSSDGLII